MKGDDAVTYRKIFYRKIRLCASNAKALGLIPGWGTKIPYAEQSDQKK